MRRLVGIPEVVDGRAGQWVRVRRLGGWGIWIKVPEAAFLPCKFSEVSEPP